jgi:diguanylate cyclase (GGDEF)-like protein
MKKPDKPQDEETRLKKLRSLNILDTPPEERFDRFTRLAKRVFNVPIALVSLVDEDRQWFKSCLGLSVGETSREISFCGHAILGDEIFLIADAAQDDRFADNPLVLNEPNFRFYAGCPLRDIDGSKLGTLCIIDTVPRSLSEEDIKTLVDLAELAERELIAIQLATMDDLTKIPNRRGFIAHCRNSLTTCARQGRPTSLAFFDLDELKPINDKFGHAEGDKALVVFADLIRNTFRDTDAYARLGGDEFAVLLTQTSMGQAEEIVARLRQSVETYNLNANLGYEISFCEGIVTLEPDHDRSIEALLMQADSLMYKKKQERSGGPNK